ncbi:Vacuolar protein sorting-associated protein 74 [Zancudomyces culisetae]|uniref:Vacuolar protein sorting-associated protein 74 n=1 Tax=Zancudomyces culisetae TaxID=1213189 RepID=A0A1R1PW82_ZANCU|nr:Vacuolar protein sorting-associated protein 74 [Zancudomyces culisetae]|eukprot:OMH85199.1 Vacuolar protein sorting-associated protein 74 [Zancudomyces culisetae]
MVGLKIQIGETWSISKAGFQLKQVRERLSKGLVDKGILRTEKKNFVFFDMATHPVQDYKAKNEIILRVFDTLNLPRSAALLNRSAGSGVSQQLNSTSMASSTINLSNLTGRLKIITVEHSKYYPNETNNLFALLRRVCLVCAACAGNVLENPLNHLDMETRDHAFMRAEELLNIYGHWPYVRDSPIYTDVSESDVASMQVEEVVSAVLSVFRRMDRVL